MKKFSKVLSSVLAASMLVSAFAMNAMAASKVHTLNVSASKTEGLVAGEQIVVEVKIDNTLDLVNVDYDLIYDATAFEVDTTVSGRNPANFIDKTWFNDIKNADGDWQYYVGTPTINGNEPGTIYFRSAGGDNGGVEADYAVDNRLIGKYTFTVKSDVADGSYEFKVAEGKSLDFGEVAVGNMAPVSVVVKVGEDAPVVPPVTYDGEAKGAFSFEVGPKYAGNEGFKVFFKETNTDTKAETTKYAEVAKPAVFDDQTTIESGMTVDLGVKVSGVPSNVVLELLRAEWLETLTVK